MITAPPCKDVAVGIHDGESGAGRIGRRGHPGEEASLVTNLGDENVVIGIDVDVGRANDVVPLIYELTVAGEDLEAIVFAVGDVEAFAAVDEHAVRQVELAGAGAGLAPGLDELASGGEAVDAAVAIAVTDVDFAVGCNGDVGGVVERAGGLLEGAVVGVGHAGVGGLVTGAEGHQQFTLEAELLHGVADIVGEEHVVVGVDVDAVRTGELAIAPGADEVAVGIEDDQGFIAAIENVDAVLRIGGDAGDVDVVVSAGHLAEAGDGAVLEIAFADDRYGCVALRGHGCLNSHVTIGEWRRGPFPSGSVYEAAHIGRLDDAVALDL